jgi:cytochrome c5
MICRFAARRLFSLAAPTLAVAGLMAGCRSSTDAESSSKAGRGEAQSPMTLSAASSQRSDAEPKSRQSGSELWSQTCNRCHNARSPDSYNANEWATVMTHMRIRGYLTGQEQRAILEFLQSQ